MGWESLDEGLMLGRRSSSWAETRYLRCGEERRLENNGTNWSYASSEALWRTDFERKDWHIMDRSKSTAAP